MGKGCVHLLACWEFCEENTHTHQRRSCYTHSNVNTQMGLDTHGLTYPPSQLQPPPAHTHVHKHHSATHSKQHPLELDKPPYAYKRGRTHTLPEAQGHTHAQFCRYSHNHPLQENILELKFYGMCVAVPCWSG